MIDISLWERDIKSQASGTRTKFWVCQPSEGSDEKIKYLFKIPTEGTGGHWAEFIASQIGAKLNFYTAEVELALNCGIKGTISKNFRAETEALYEGGDLFLAQFENFDRHSLINYELPHILTILTEYNLEKDFVAIPVFDALIANSDRHCDNWGVLDGPWGIRLAPIYDNGSSLGFNTVGSQKQKMLTNNHMLEGFCNRGKSSIGLPNKKRPKHFELLTLLNSYLPDEVAYAMERIKHLNKEMLYMVIDPIPNHLMSELDKEWVTRLLLYRKEWLLKWYGRSARYETKTF
ncbi:HipA domain-containing protein [Solibacillus silvestris]|uniref:HipA domain-containing protein n=1 Tax=Solibacillus silvestris TaxID=76853 RepID=UPI003F806290